MIADTGSARRRSWSAIATEIAVVVAGILIAFALDSWWDRRADARREVAHLLALHADFQYNLEQLRRQSMRAEGTGQASRNLLRLMRSGPLPPRDSVVDLLGQVFDSGQFVPAMGAYQAILGAGDLALIRDDALRRGMAEFAAAIDTRYAERFAEHFYFQFISEFTGRLHWLDLLDDRTRRDLGVPPGPATLDIAALARDPRFEDHLMMRVLSARDVARQYGALAQRAEAILAGIAARLEEMGESPPTAAEAAAPPEG